MTLRWPMNFKSQPFLRTLGLLWRQLGAVRIYLLAGAACLLVLAAFGVVHLISLPDRPNNKPVISKPVATEALAKAPTPQASPSPRVDEPVQEPSLTITEVSPKATRLRDGSTNVTVLIGVAPRTTTKKGEVEIQVSFFDITRDYQLRPTDAQVGSEWITPVRDWTDPTPKYLEASCIRPRRSHRSRERLRYGGFLVRVYLDGKLQDERSEPREVLTALRAARPLAASAESAAMTAVDPDVDDEDNDPPATLAPIPAPSPRVAVSAPPPKTTTGEPSPAPYGSPVPDKPGFVYSPYNDKFLIDVRGVPPGTEVNDPNTGKPLRVP